MINLYTMDSSELKIELKEVLRYMGCSGDKLQQNIINTANELIDEISPKLSLKACYKKYNVTFNDETIDLGFTTSNSKDLAKNLKGCNGLVLFVATIGIAADRIIAKYSLSSPLKATAAQAVGAAAIESWCDIVCNRIKTEYGETCPRFSAGYGDLPLSMQKDILNQLDSSRKIGVTLTDSMLMLPTKSVSAIVGIKK